MHQKFSQILLFGALLLLSACSSQQDLIVVSLKDGSSIEFNTDKDSQDFKKFLEINNPDNYKSFSEVSKELRVYIEKIKSIKWGSSTLSLREDKFYKGNGFQESQFYPRDSLLVLIMLTVRDYERSRNFYTNSKTFDFDSYVFIDRKNRRKIKVLDHEKVEALKGFLMQAKKDKAHHISYINFSVYSALSLLSIELYKGSRFIGEIDFSLNKKYPLRKIHINELTLKYLDSKNLLDSVLSTEKFKR